MNIRMNKQELININHSQRELLTFFCGVTLINIIFSDNNK